MSDSANPVGRVIELAARATRALAITAAPWDYEVKLKEAMNEVFVGMMRASAIDNKLTGRVKLANEELLAESQTDGDVQLMAGNPPPAPTPASATTPAGNAPRSQPAAGADTNAPRMNVPTPAAASPEVIQQTKKFTTAPVKKQASP